MFSSTPKMQLLGFGLVYAKAISQHTFEASCIIEETVADCHFNALALLVVTARRRYFM